MTNEEAREVLQEQIDKYGQEYDDRGIEALKTAIKMLEQQPCEDCISREALRQKLQEHNNFFLNAYCSYENMTFKEKARVDEIDNCIAMVVNAPSVTPSYNSINTELKPSDDCISREEAIRIAEQGQIQGYEWQFKKLCNLPSVTPQPKTGHWIDVESLDSALWHECSECGETEFYATDYCPNCGAKMVEPQESEDKG